MGSPSHEKLVLLAPECRHGEDPADLGSCYFANLLSKFVKGLFPDEFESFCNDLDKGHFLAISRYSVGLHVQEVHFILSEHTLTL